MEITNEIKAKVFGQYLSYFADQPTRFVFLKIIENLLNGVAVKYRIELKPLSTISDEDFIEASKLLPYDFKTDKDFDVFRGEAPFRIYRGEGSTVASNIVYANTTGTKIFKIFVDDGTIMLDDRIAPPCYTKHALIIYQFLQSKGYDLPNYHLGGKTLEQAGLAYYPSPVELSINDATKMFFEQYSKDYPEINAVGSTNAQSLDGVKFHEETIVVDLKHTANVNEMPVKYMGFDVIYQMDDSKHCDNCRYYSNTCGRYIMNPKLDRQECGKPETGYPHWEAKNK